jgi:segregation and condensation protein A
MEESKSFMLHRVKSERSMSFEKIFMQCENRIHAIFLFLSMLELVQQQYFTLLVGEGRNNLLVEWNTDLPDDHIIPIIPVNPELN